MNESPKVMVVEDEAIIALDIQRQLTTAGFTVAGKAQSAEGAFQEIERQHPDIVLMDIRIKGDMDGVQAAAIVRSRYALPVVYLTAHTDTVTLKRAQDTEPFGFLVKPLVSANLKATLTMALHKHRMERELEGRYKLFAEILQGLPDAVLVARVSGELLFLNPAAERVTGWSLREATDKHIFEIAAIRDQDGKALPLETLRIPAHSTLVAKGGETVPVAGQLSVLSVDGQAAGILMTLQR